MIAKDRLSQEFLEGIREIEPLLSILGFSSYSFYEKGPAYYIKYKKTTTESIVEFLFGPSGYEVEMIIFTSKGKFAFKDLLQISEIASWVNDNKYLLGAQKGIKIDVLWFFELLKFSLPIVE